MQIVERIETKTALPDCEIITLWVAQASGQWLLTDYGETHRWYNNNNFIINFPSNAILVNLNLLIDKNYIFLMPTRKKPTAKDINRMATAIRNFASTASH